MGHLKRFDRLPASETGIHFMPEGDIPFPILPAEIDFVPVSQCGKIQQAQVDILDLHARVQDTMDERVEFFEILHHVAQGAVPAVSHRFFNGGPGFGLVRQDLPAYRLDFIHERADDLQGIVGLLKGKVLGHVGSIH